MDEHVVCCKRCRRHILAGVEAFPKDNIRVDCPLCGETRRYRPAEVYLGWPSENDLKQQAQQASRSESRKRKRIKEKMRLEYFKQQELEQIKEQEEWKAANEERSKAQYEKGNSLNSKLWAWGVNSEKHPTRNIGVFATIIMYLFVVPVMGFLYKLSFTLWVPVIYVGVGLVAMLYWKIKKIMSSSKAGR